MGQTLKKPPLRILIACIGGMLAGELPGRIPVEFVVPPSNGDESVVGGATATTWTVQRRFVMVMLFVLGYIV